MTACRTRPPGGRRGTARALWLQRRGAGLAGSVGAGPLKLDAPRGVLTPELLNELAERKADLIEFLAPSSPSPPGLLCPGCKRSHLDDRGACWRCMARPCVDCGANTGSAFVARCVSCGNRHNGNGGGWS